MIYDEWIGYYAWMWKVKEQIERISIQSTREQAEEIYSSSFAAITALGSVIDEKLCEHIYRCMELAHLDSPSSRRTSTARTARRRWAWRRALSGRCSGTERRWRRGC